MSESPENLDPKEATEARLCAYLESEMPPAERAEIEKYLESNPQHRQLLNDLAKTRSLLGSLPRESAPPEIAEAFEGQLERSMLLDGTGTSETAAGVNRAPQVLLAAAIILLALGLGVVVYFTLPGAPPPKFSTVVQPKATSAPTEAETSVAAAKPETPTAVESKLGATESLAAKPATGPAEVLAAKEPANSAGPVVTSTPPASLAWNNVARDEQNTVDGKTATGTVPLSIASAPVIKGLQDQLARAGYERSDSTLPANTVCVVVSSDDPSATTHEIQSYLTANNILYESHPAAASNLVVQGKGMTAPVVGQSRVDAIDQRVRAAAGDKDKAANGVGGEWMKAANQADQSPPAAGNSAPGQNVDGANYGIGNDRQQSNQQASNAPQEQARPRPTTISTSRAG